MGARVRRNLNALAGELGSLHSADELRAKDPSYPHRQSSMGWSFGFVLLGFLLFMDGWLWCTLGWAVIEDVRGLGCMNAVQFNERILGTGFAARVVKVSSLLRNYPSLPHPLDG